MEFKALTLTGQNELDHDMKAGFTGLLLRNLI